MSTLVTERNEGTFFGHPKGLLILFFTEMWERFSFYGMRALLVLFLKDEAATGGFGWTHENAIYLYGWYGMLVYVLGIPGGIIADKWLGQKKSVMIGGALLVLGHSIMAIPNEMAFYSALVIIILGVGLLKPNISTMVGSLYKKDDIRRDKGFTIFYMGINLGALTSAIACGYLGQEVGWHYGFGLAGIGMLFGQIVFIRGQKHLTHVGNAPEKNKAKVEGGSSIDFSKAFSDIGGIVATLFFVGLAALTYFEFGKIGEAAMLLIAAPFFGIGAYIYRKDLNRIEKDRTIVLLASFVVVIVFWASFEQAGGMMNIYTDEKVDLSLGLFEIPSTWFQSANAFFIVIFGVPVAAFWAIMKLHKITSSSLVKMAFGNIIMGLGFLFMVGAAMQYNEDLGIKAGMYWIILAYMFHTIGELCISPVSLSFLTKLAPARYGSIMMGLYFAVTGVGNKLAAAIGTSADAVGGEENLFYLITAIAVGFGVLLLIVAKPLIRMTRGAEESEPEKRLAAEA